MMSSAALDAHRGTVRRQLAAVGAVVIAAIRWPCFVTGMAFATVRAAADPLSWRRPVRSELRRLLAGAAGGTLPITLGAAILVGIAMVFQALYWLGAAGQDTLINQVIAGLLIREVAPLVVGLLLAGRSGTATLIEVGEIRGGARFRLLAASGIDPLLLLVLPRVVAFAIAAPALTVLFVAIALVSGWTMDVLVSARPLDLPSFLDDILQAMAPNDFILVPLKGVLIGAVVALVCCAVPVGAPSLASVPARLVPRGFAYTLLSVLLVSGIVSILL
ncbi:MlaE family ABC transporter permease [Elioraea thermophila]|uniref:MlaE family ABC transporter permease n=1 Tax=Elioraea thermophila TaxID=2185104 RepID=UPI000DF31F1C|nr:ABC transporter permease [Elioraea thermophila]